MMAKCKSPCGSPTYHPPGPVTAPAISTDQTAYTIPQTSDRRTPSTVRVPTTADVVIHSFERPPSSPSTFTIVNTGPRTFTIPNESTTEPDPLLRVRTPTEGPLDVGPGKTVTLEWDVTIQRWRVPGGTSTSYDVTVAPPQTIATTEDDLAIDNPAPVVPLTPTADSTLTGIEWPTAGPGQITFVNDTAFSITLTHQDPGSLTANQFFLSTLAPVVIPPGVSFVVWKAPDGTLKVESPALFEGESIILPVDSEPASNPPADTVAVYVDADGDLAYKDSAGATAKVGAGGGSARTEGTLAAAGSTQGTAAAVTTDAVNVTGADGTKGVILWNKEAAQIVVRNNAGGGELKVYPPSGAAINDLTADAAETVEVDGVYLFCRVTSTFWSSTILFGGA